MKLVLENIRYLLITYATYASFYNVDIPGVTMIGGPQQFAIVGKIKKLLCEYDAVPSVSEVQWIKRRCDC